MAGKVAIGIQDYSVLIENKYFYIDKTSFIKEWWESGDSVTLINRPRRFGKTLNISMTEQFFSVDYAGRGDLFEGLFIWKDEKYRKIQGTYPVISLSFANVKERNYTNTRDKICQLICTDTMGKRLLFFWMNMILLCRKRMWTDFCAKATSQVKARFHLATAREPAHLNVPVGMNLLLSPEVCSMPYLRPIHGWNEDL